MPNHYVTYSIDGHAFEYTVDAELAAPENRVLLLEDDDLTKACSWHKTGYGAVTAWGEDLTNELKDTLQEFIAERVEEVCERKFTLPLEQYHTFVSNDEHMELVGEFKQLPITARNLLPLDILDEHISDVLGTRVTCYNPRIERYGCSLRIVRPTSHDNNPLHKDVWLDRLRHAVNLYIPLAGSGPKTSLSLIPGSHYWNESDMQRTQDHCAVNGLTYTVPSVVASVHGLNMVRPPLAGNEILVFSPYLIHGGAVNISGDITRMSLEMRFWRKG